MIFEQALFLMICCFVIGVFCGHINSGISNISGYQPDGRNKLDTSKPPQGGSGISETCFITEEPKGVYNTTNSKKFELTAVESDDTNGIYTEAVNVSSGSVKTSKRYVRFFAKVIANDI